ncbi:unnamed protein product [Microthlaspi erraticum]|uniref:GRF-type domain-containing protein n=1 Tax=Microthlaspi erraticum TaxID=1685480 RepID=A0A6D2KH91_9BRAS|nr:unnamed protein product [Microthlaspi erraticum]
MDSGEGIRVVRSIVQRRMSMETTASNTSSIGRDRRRFVGVPKRCWCGKHIMELISKSTSNPYRRYYRCAFAVEQKLSNDPHIFKWVEEACLDEIETLVARTVALEEKLQRIGQGRQEFETRVEAALVAKVEEELLGKVEKLVSASHSRMKQTMVVVCVGFAVIIGWSKFVR